VVYVPEWGFALVENAVQNGVHVHLDTEVSQVTRDEDGTYFLSTSRGTLKTKYVINAAVSTSMKSREWSETPMFGSIAERTMVILTSPCPTWRET